MRTIFGILALSTSLVACMGDIFGPYPSSTDSSYTDAQLAGTWIGEVSGVRLSIAMDAATCEWGCSAQGVVTYVRTATGDSGSALASVFYTPGIPSTSSVSISFTAAAPDDTELRSSLFADMPDASHLVGRFDYDDLLQIDTVSTITFARQ